MAAPCRYGRGCRRPDCYFAHPEGRDIDGTTGGSGASSSGGSPQGSSGGRGGTPCRFDRKCNRLECYFAHPNGREIDEKVPTPGAGKKEEPVAVGNGREHAQEDDAQMMKNLEDAADEDPAGYHQDQWIPSSRDCSCCKGFVYNCNDPTCNSLGICGCAAEADLNL